MKSTEKELQKIPTLRRRSKNVEFRYDLKIYINGCKDRTYAHNTHPEIESEYSFTFDKVYFI